MIEKMIEEINPFLPLKISSVELSNTQLKISGEDWSFTTISVWRITEGEKMLLGCFDTDADINEVLNLKNIVIIEVGFQDPLLKLDPIFIFSNNQVLEIFSVNVIEPWTFMLKPVGDFVATPSEPSAFIKS